MKRIFNSIQYLLSPRSWLKLWIGFFILAAFFVTARTTFEYKRYARALYLFAGDEPKYLRMAQSLAEDNDLDVSNFWGSREDIARLRERASAKATRRYGHLYVFGKNKGIYSLHMPGVAFLIYPGYVLDLLRFPHKSVRTSKNLPFLPDRLIFTRLSLLVMAAVSLLLLLRLLSSLFPSLLVTAILLLVFVFDSPFCRIGLQVYPDGPALLFLLLAMNAVWHPFPDKRVNDILFVLSIGFLPWLHQRFIPISLAIYLVLIIRCRHGGSFFKRLLPISGALFLLSLPYFYYFFSITGNPSPLSLVRTYGEKFIQLSILPLGFFGQLFSTKAGLLWLHPWALFFLIGIFQGLKKERRHSLELLLVFFPYYLACSGAFPWTGASSPAGRFSVPILPVYLIFAGFAADGLLRASSPKKWLFYGLLVSPFLINKVHAFVHLDFGYGRVTAADLGAMLIVGLYLVILYGALFLAERKKRSIASV